MNVTRDVVGDILGSKPAAGVKSEFSYFEDETLENTQNQKLQNVVAALGEFGTVITPTLDTDTKTLVRTSFGPSILNYFGASQVAMDNLADRSDKLAEVMGVMHSGFTSAFRTMNEKFGEPSEYLSSNNGLVTSVWGRISELQESFTALELQNKATTQTAYTTKKFQSTINKKVIDTLGGYKSSIQNIIREMDEVKKGLVASAYGSSQTPRQGNVTLEALDEVDLLPAGKNHRTKSAGFIGEKQSSTGNVLQRELDSAENSSKVSELGNRISLLEARMGSLKGEKGTDENSRIVSMCGTTFNSSRDMHDWVEKYVLIDDMLEGSDVPPFAVFVDPYTLYQKLVETILGSEFEHKGLTAQLSLRFNGDQMLVMSTFYSPVPSIFSGPPRSTDRIYTGGGKNGRFPHVKTYKDFEDDGHRDGLRVQIDANKPHAESSVNTMIGDQLFGEKRAEARALATKMLSKSLEFITAVNTYITDTYKEVLQSSGDPAIAWDLVTFIVQQMFKEEFHVVRAGVRGGIDPARPKLTALRIMWATFRTMEVVESFLRLGIKNHPSVSGSYVRFMVTNSQAAEVRSLVTKVLNFEKDFKTLKADYASLEKKLVTVQSQADKALSVANAAKKEKLRNGGGGGSSSGS